MPGCLANWLSGHVIMIRIGECSEPIPIVVCICADVRSKCLLGNAVTIITKRSIVKSTCKIMPVNQRSIPYVCS